MTDIHVANWKTMLAGEKFGTEPQFLPLRHAFMWS